MRLYAEDPRSFLPQAGRIERLRLPTGIRVDAGVEEGDEIGLAYDPMIAKLIAQGRTRDEALDRLADALRETAVEGVTTNLPFLRWLVGHPDRARRRDDDCLPGRASAALGAPHSGGTASVARAVPAQPPRSAAGPAAGSRRSRAAHTAQAAARAR